MKTFKKILLILFLFLILIYTSNLSAIPSSLILFQGEALNIPTLFGINISPNQTYTTSSNVGAVALGDQNIQQEDIKSTGTYNLNIKLANVKIKEMTVNVVPKSSVVLCGEAIGAKLYTNGVLVVGMSEIEGVKPYENSGIEEGDMITKIDEEWVTCTADLIEKVSKSGRK